MRAPLLLGLALLVTALPGAEAQGPQCGALMATCQTTTSVILAPPSEPIPPGGMLSLPLQAEYTYAPTTFTMAPTAVSLTVTQAPPWVEATANPATLMMPVQTVPACLCQHVAYASGFLALAADPDAPAFEQGIVEVTATAAPNGNLMGSSGRTQIPVQVGYFGALELVTPTPSLALAPRDGGLVPIHVENLGNAATRVTFEVQDAPAGIRVTLPGEVTLPSGWESEQTGKMVAIGLEATGRYLPGEVVLVARPAYALNPAFVGTPARLTLHVAPPGASDDASVQTLGAGGSQAVEPLTFGLLAAGAAGVALLERHRRRKA